MARFVREQFRVRPLFGDLPTVDDDDAVRIAHRAQPVRDDQYRSPLADSLHVVLDDALGLVVERARRLVENQDARVADQRPGDGDALALVAGESRTVFADERVVAFRQFEKRPITSPASMTRSIPRRISGESGR